MSGGTIRTGNGGNGGNSTLKCKSRMDYDHDAYGYGGYGGYGGGGGGNGIVWSVDVLQVILVIVGIIMTQYFLCLEPKKKREAASKLEEYPK